MSSPAPIDYETLFQALNTAYIVFAADDPLFTIIEENQAHAELAMVQRARVIGRPLFDVFPDVSEEYKKTGKSQLRESIRRVIKTAQPDVLPTLKYDIRNEQGTFTRKYWSVTHHPVMDEDGKVIAVYQATRDITDERLTEQRLVSTQHQLDQALRSGMIGTWKWDIPHEKIYANQNLADMFGLDYEQAKRGLPLEAFIDAIHPGDRVRVQKEIKRTLKRVGPFESEYRTINHEGNVRWVIARGLIETDEQGNLQHFPGVVVDITERKNAETNLNFLTRASTLFSASLDYKETLNNIAQMVVPTIADWCSVEVLDEQGELQQVAVAHKDPEKVAWAKELRAQQGPPDLSGTSGVAKVIRTGVLEHYPVITDAMLAASTEDEKELDLVRSLGFSSVMILPLIVVGKTIGVITLVATESRIHYQDVDVEMAKGLANRASLAIYNANLYQAAQTEIRERERLQGELEAANEELENRVAERTKQLEKTNAGLQKEIMKRHEAERVLQEYGKNLSRSNQELQDFAYVASHDLQEPLRKIQAFGDLLESEYGSEIGEGIEYLKRMRNAASRMSVLIEDLLAFSRVTTKVHSNVAVNLNTIADEVVGDLEARIAQTNGQIDVQPLPTVWADATHMRQLLQNLIGNALKFHRKDIPPQVKVYTQPIAASDTCYSICVEDNGIGFDEKYLDRIFSVFQRLHGKDMYEGTGIGLAVCRKIAERYGGTITATSKKNTGSIFTFSIPIMGKESSDE
jgi:PAS domain S-box-containing protein